MLDTNPAEVKFNDLWIGPMWNSDTYMMLSFLSGQKEVLDAFSGI